MEKQRHKYETLYEYLKKEIRSGAFGGGQKIPPENELAARFSISRFTVRRAIELLTNEGYLEKRHGSGTYVRAVSPDINRSGVVGVVTTYLDDYIFPSIIRGIETVLSAHGYSLSLSITENRTEKETACLRSMLGRNIDGLIIEGTKSAQLSPNIGILEAFRARGVPIVFINGDYSDYESSCVLMDDEKSGECVANYLMEQGHTRIGGLFKSDDIQGHRRFQGMARAMAERGLFPEEKSVLWYATEDVGHIFSPGYDRSFLRRFEDCTALICYNDQIAAKAIGTFERNGRSIPRDLSIVGFDNFYQGDAGDAACVRLASVTHARDVMGETAANTLLSLHGAKTQGSGPVRLILPAALVPGSSVRSLI